MISFASMFVQDSKIVWNVKDEKFKIITFLIYVLSRLLITLYLYSLISISWIINHMFIRTLVAMKSLGGAMYFNTVKDVVCEYMYYICTSCTYIA